MPKPQRPHRNESLPRCTCGHFRYEHSASKQFREDADLSVWRKCQVPRCTCGAYTDPTIYPPA